MRQAALIVLCLFAAAAHGFERELDPNGNPEHWTDYKAVPYCFAAGSPKNFRQAVTDCLQEWQDACGGSLHFVLQADTKSQDTAQGIVFVFENKFTDNLANAINGGSTTNTTDPNTGVLLRSIVVLNQKFFLWHRGAPTLRTTKGKMDRSFDAILLHEIGHALGLAHNSLFDSVMFGQVGHVFIGSDDILAVKVVSGDSP